MPSTGIFLVSVDSMSGLDEALGSILAGHFKVTPMSALKLASQDPRACAEADGITGTRAASPQAVVMLASKLGEDALRAAQSVRMSLPTLPILLVTTDRDPDRVLRTLEHGVADFVTPPLCAGELLPRLWRLVRNRSRREEIVRPVRLNAALAELIGQSAAFRSVVKKIPLLARYDGTVLLEGETGTGKGLFARAIHYLSLRSEAPFVPVDCGGLPLELLENELFGHREAAYTGATSSRRGLVHAAEGGTLFLDEVDCLSPAAQVKLLRLLQDKQYRPVGSNRVYTANIRLIAASNTDLEEALRQKRIRRDFFYRLNVLRLRLPPLRERPDDILLLADHFLGNFARKLGVAAPSLTASAAQKLMFHDWPGNVRELEHAVERAILLAEGRIVVTEAEFDLTGGPQHQAASFREAKALAVAQFEKSYIESLLHVFGGNITRAAEAAQKNRRAFWELIRKHNIQTQQFRPASC